VTVSIRKFRVIVLVSNRIEYWSNYSIQFEISDIRTALQFVADKTKTSAMLQAGVLSEYYRQGRPGVVYHV